MESTTAVSPAVTQPLSRAHQTGQRFPAVGAGDVPVAVGDQLPVHDLLLGHLHKTDPRPAGRSVVSLHQLDHPGHGDRVADHGRLGHAGSDGHGGKPAFFRVGFTVVAVDRVGVVGLHADDFGQGVDDAGFKKFEKPAHDGGDVAGVADGHHHHLVGQVVFELLGDFIGVGLLAEDPPGVFGVEQGHVVLFGQGLDHLHAVVEHPGNLEDGGPAAQGLGELLGGHFPVGQQNGGFDVRLEIGGIQGGGGEVSPVEAQMARTSATRPCRIRKLI